jgi:hypothetical protein
MSSSQQSVVKKTRAASFRVPSGRNLGPHTRARKHVSRGFLDIVEVAGMHLVFPGVNMPGRGGRGKSMFVWLVT